ncbi:MAG: hypothetical protein OSB02_08380 [Rhodospirillaceae bacterium]|nr:hypothetical protein [Rhodospirillaceae bacterium]
MARFMAVLCGIARYDRFSLSRRVECCAKVTMRVPGLSKVVPSQRAAPPNAKDQPVE